MNLQFQEVQNFTTQKGCFYPKIRMSYQIFGKVLHSAPIVLVNHALTGNSDAASKEKGWWKEIIGANKLIDTEKYTIIAFNIPGNGYDGRLINDYQNFIAKDIAKIFHSALKNLKINELFAVIGGSLGGGIAWEMACLFPNFAQYIIPIASNYKSSDWIIGHNHIQESIMLNSKKPVEDARKMAMLFYRTPLSFTKKFNRTRASGSTKYNVESWLIHHGNKLKNRFEVSAYLMMNNLLTTINVLDEKKSLLETFGKIESTIIQIAVSSDLFFIPEENVETKIILDDLKINNQYHEIQSIDGHDAFLIEHEQLTKFLTPIF